MKRVVGLFALVLLVAGGAAWLILGQGSETAEQTAMAVDSPYWSDDADRIVDVDGVSARVRVEGAEGAPVIVLVHGFSHSLESWDGWAQDLSADYRVVRDALLAVD